MLTELSESPPSTLSEILFPPPARRRTPLGILMWWESRRLVYNAIVGVTGLFALAVIGGISLIPPGLGVHAAPPLVGILAYGAAANLCYTFGPAVEIALQQIWKYKVLPVGPALFRQGLAFSVGLTLLPIMVVSAAWVLRVFSWAFGAPRL